MGCIRNGKRRKRRLPRVPSVRSVVSISPTAKLRIFMAHRTERTVSPRNSRSSAGKIPFGFSQLPFLRLSVRIKCIKNIVIENKRLILAISQSSVHKILKNENFCGIICKETNIQARGSTPPPIHKPQQATPHGLLRLNRLNRLNCLRFLYCLTKSGRCRIG